MSISSIIRWLKPREKVFFDLLEKSAGNICEALKYFQEEIKTNDPERWPELRRQMKVFEHTGDDINQEIIDTLDATFVTPIERDDILQLSNALDDVIDRMDAVSEKLVLYNVGKLHPTVPEITGMIMDGVSELMFLMQSLRKITNIKEIRNTIRRIQDMESRVDAIYNASMGNLFTTSTDAIELIKWKEIIKELEDATDSIALVAKVVGATVTKNA